MYPSNEWIAILKNVVGIVCICYSISCINKGTSFMLKALDILCSIMIHCSTFNFRRKGTTRYARWERSNGHTRNTGCTRPKWTPRPRRFSRKTRRTRCRTWWKNWWPRTRWLVYFGYFYFLMYKIQHSASINNIQL